MLVAKQVSNDLNRYLAIYPQGNEGGSKFQINVSSRFAHQQLFLVES